MMSPLHHLSQPHTEIPSLMDYWTGFVIAVKIYHNCFLIEETARSIVTSNSLLYHPHVCPNPHFISTSSLHYLYLVIIEQGRDECPREGVVLNALANW